jgi:hypothetical protein
MRCGRTLPAVLVLAFTALAGCDDPIGPDASSATPTDTPVSESPTGSESETPTQTPTASPTGEPTELPRSQVRAAVLHTAALGQTSARTAEEKAVVTAWMGYWQAATNTYFYARAPQTLTRYAADAALKDVRDYQASLKAKQERVVGWARDNVTKVAVDGNRATVRDCTENYTFNVDEEGAPQTNKMVPWYDARGVLEKRQGRWVVTEASSRKLQKSCLG